MDRNWSNHHMRILGELKKNQNPLRSQMFYFLDTDSYKMWWKIFSLALILISKYHWTLFPHGNVTELLTKSVCIFETALLKAVESRQLMHGWHHPFCCTLVTLLSQGMATCPPELLKVPIPTSSINAWSTPVYLQTFTLVTPISHLSFNACCTDL